MGRNQNTIAKRQREMAKKRKAEEKRVLRREKKERSEMKLSQQSDEDSGKESVPAVPS